MQMSTCARSAQIARQMLTTLSAVCCFSSRKDRQRDEIKAFSGSRTARDRTRELRWGEEDDDEDDGGPGSGDGDVLTSLGASYRAWRVYHREKQAHDYTKSRFVDAIRREAALGKQLARVGGSIEGIERTLMRLEDLEATVMVLEGKYDAAVTGQVACEDLALELEALQRQCLVQTDLLHEAQAAALRWKTQCQQALPELASSSIEKERLVNELRKVKKTVALMMKRQHIHFDTNGASHPLSARHHNNEDKNRSYSDLEIT